MYINILLELSFSPPLSELHEKNEILEIFFTKSGITVHQYFFDSFS